MSWVNGVPITAHQGLSRSRSFGQQAPHSTPGCETWRRHPAQTGGNRMRAGKASALRAMVLIPMVLIFGIGSATWLVLRHYIRARKNRDLPVAANHRHLALADAQAPRPGPPRRRRRFPDAAGG